MTMPVKHEIETQRPKPKQAPVKKMVSLREPTPKKKPDDPPGTMPDHQIPIYDHNGHLRGRCGPKATSVTVARFLNRHGAKLGKKDGKDAWIGQEPPKPPKPPKPVIAPQPKSVIAPQPKPGQAQQHKLEISLKAARGSVTKTPKSRPETHVRPHRG